MNVGASAKVVCWLLTSRRERVADLVEQWEVSHRKRLRRGRLLARDDGSIDVFLPRRQNSRGEMPERRPPAGGPIKLAYPLASGDQLLVG
jgi:hypothetical protein